MSMSTNRCRGFLNQINTTSCSYWVFFRARHLLLLLASSSYCFNVLAAFTMIVSSVDFVGFTALSCEPFYLTVFVIGLLSFLPNPRRFKYDEVAPHQVRSHCLEF